MFQPAFVSTRKKSRLKQASAKNNAQFETSLTQIRSKKLVLKGSNQ